MTTNRMSNFKRLAERFALGEKLLTTQEKLAVMGHRLRGREDFAAATDSEARSPKVRLVLKVRKKHVSH